MLTPWSSELVAIIHTVNDFILLSILMSRGIVNILLK